jgi:FkbM family methyltransferase
MQHANNSLLRQLFDAAMTSGGYEPDGFPFDTERFSDRVDKGVRSRLKGRVRRYLWNRVFRARASEAQRWRRTQLATYGALLPRLEWLHDRLSDEYSRATLRSIMSARLLGLDSYRLPRNTDQYWQQRASIADLRASDMEVDIAFMNWSLDHYDLSSIGFPIQVLGRPAGMQHEFLLGQYKYDKSETVRAQPGDVVFDCGACWGEIALYFAHLVGTTGRVFTFEFIPSNLAILRRNLAMNPELSGRIEVVQRPLWNESGVEMYFSDEGPGSRVSLKPGVDDAGHVPSLSISDLVADLHPPKLDFIKMDIEGAELFALKGAERILREQRPTLAISVYHRPEDLVEIPEYLDSLALGYRFYLDHFTTHDEETVLFAIAR